VLGAPHLADLQNQGLAPAGPLALILTHLRFVVSLNDTESLFDAVLPEDALQLTAFSVVAALFIVWTSTSVNIPAKPVVGVSISHSKVRPTTLNLLYFAVGVKATS
jgi:hypothetical protein